MLINPSFLYKFCITLVIAPLISSFVSGLSNKIIDKYATKVIGIINIFFFSISITLIAYFLWQHCYNGNKIINVSWYKLALISNLQLEFGFLLDGLNLLMLAVIAGIAIVVQIYSIRFMYHDPNYYRFCAYIAFFVFAMFLLIISNNFLQLFFGWELVGLSSYLLINYSFHKKETNSAALKSFIINRFGDCSLILAIAAIFNYCGTFDYIIAFNNLPNETSVINLICGLFFIAAITKSAQMPLHNWLLDAMQGPLPASTLIHSATMVTLGIFILVRISPILAKSFYWLNVILFIGSITTLLMGALAAIEKEFKRILAYSTMSQLGIMMIAIGGSSFAISIVHLINHAFFKSLLFLSLGSVILSEKATNINKLPRELKKQSSAAYWGMLIANLAMSGFPGFSSFFYKELIITAVKATNFPCAKVAYYTLIISSFITVFYSFRLFFLIFYNNNNYKKCLLGLGSKLISYPITALSFLSTTSGGLFFALMITNNKLSITNTIGAPKQQLTTFSETLYHKVFTASNLSLLLGIIIIIFIYYFKRKYLYNSIKSQTKKNFLFFYKTIKNEYFINEIYKILLFVFKALATLCDKIIEQLIIEQLIVANFYKSIVYFGKFMQKFQTRALYNDIFIMLTGVLVITICLFLTII